jgi:hypothetical protein
MKAISGVTDPDELVEIYANGIGELIAIEDCVAVSRRHVDPPFYLVTRSSRFAEHVKPWTQRELLPMLSSGPLGANAAEFPFHHHPAALGVPSGASGASSGVGAVRLFPVRRIATNKKRILPAKGKWMSSDGWGSGFE